MSRPFWGGTDDSADEEDSSAPNVRFTQQNRATRRGSIYTNQGYGSMNINHYAAGRRGVSGWFFVTMLLVDCAYFLYGMTAYSGQNSNADTWRAIIFLVLLFLTGLSLRVWLRRRF